MRILFTMTGSWGTGSGNLVESLVRQLSRRGHECAVLYPAAADMPDAQIKRAPAATHLRVPFPIHEDGVELYAYPLMIPDSNPGDLHRAETYEQLSDPQLDLLERTFTDALEGAVEYFQPDVIECQHIWMMAAIASRFNIPFVAAAHCSDQRAFVSDPRMRPLAQEAASAARRIFALTHDHRDEVIALYGVPSDRVVVTGNGYDRSVFFPRRVDKSEVAARLGIPLPDDAPVVTFAGKLALPEGVGTLLEANRILRDRMINPPAILLFGGDDLSNTLHAEVRPINANEVDGVHWLENHPATLLADVYNVAHCSVLPSRTEGFELAVLESLACGLPTVVVGEPDGLSPSGVGATVSTGDAAALADAIERLVTMSNGDHSELRAQALSAAAQLSWANIADARLNAYQHVRAVTAD